jgi:hypothetical protein
MFGRRFFGGRYFGARYFGDGGNATSNGVSYFGGKYFGARHFGHRYFGTHPQSSTAFNVVAGGIALSGTPVLSGDLQSLSLLNLAQTAPLGISGQAGLTGNIGLLLAFEFEPPLSIDTVIGGTLGVSGDIQITRAFNVVRTAAIGLNASMTLNGNIGTVINITPSALALSGSLSAVGNLAYTTGTPFNVAQTADVQMVGTALVVGNIAAIDSPPFNLVPSTLQLGGVFGVAGGFEFENGPPFNLQPTSALGVVGALSTPPTTLKITLLITGRANNYMYVPASAGVMRVPATGTTMKV